MTCTFHVLDVNLGWALRVRRAQIYGACTLTSWNLQFGEEDRTRTIKSYNLSQRRLVPVGRHKSPKARRVVFAQGEHDVGSLDLTYGEMARIGFMRCWSLGHELWQGK